MDTDLEQQDCDTFRPSISGSTTETSWQRTNPKEQRDDKNCESSKPVLNEVSSNSAATAHSRRIDNDASLLSGGSATDYKKPLGSLKAEDSQDFTFFDNSLKASHDGSVLDPLPGQGMGEGEGGSPSFISCFQVSPQLSVISASKKGVSGVAGSHSPTRPPSSFSPQLHVTSTGDSSLPCAQTQGSERCPSVGGRLSASILESMTRNQVANASQQQDKIQPHEPYSFCHGAHQEISGGRSLASESYGVLEMIHDNQQLAHKPLNGQPPVLRLRGGTSETNSNGTAAWGAPPPPSAANAGWGQASSGGSSAVSAGSGWGTPPRPTPNGQVPGAQGEFNQNDFPGKAAVAAATGSGSGGSTGQHGSGATSWAQAAGKGLPPSNNSQSSADAAAQKRELEKIREALHSNDGWGGQNVNQDTAWDVPSPPHSPKDENPNKPAPNTGTELWHANLRNGGVPRAEPQPSKAQWTPSTNRFGGQWGEDDNDADGGSMWHDGASQWGATGGPSTNMWGGGGGGGVGGGDSGSGGSGWAMPPKPGGPVNNWGNQGVKDVKPVGWEEPSPPTNRRGMGGSYDDGTGVWSAGTQPQGKINRWSKDMPPGQMGRGMGGPQSRMPPPGPSGMMQRSSGYRGWDDSGHPDGGPSGWAGHGGDPTSPVGGPMGWVKAKGHGSHWAGDNDLMDGSPWPGPVNKPNTPQQPWQSASSFAWMDQMSVMDPGWPWPDNRKHKGLTQIPKEALYPSKFRILAEMGYKKEDIEAAMRHNNFNMDDALMELSRTYGRGALGAGLHSDMDPTNWGGAPRMDEGSGPAPAGPQFNTGIPPNLHFTGADATGNRYGAGPAQVPFNPPGGAGVGSGGSLLNAPPQSGTPNLGNMNPAFMHRLLQQQQQQQVGRGPPNTPSNQQLNLLASQINLAVQAGHLHPGILSQKLSNNTLHLLSQLLHQIKVLQELNRQQALLQTQSQFNRSAPSSLLNLSVQVTKCKQNIANLQNQIAVQQALYMKQQQHQGPAGHGGDAFKPPSGLGMTTGADPMNALLPPLANLDLGGGGVPSVPLCDPQQTPPSRLFNQWKHPSKDEQVTGPNAGNEFSRAPGPLSSSSKSNMAPTTSPLNTPLLGAGDSTWSVPPTSRDSGGWPDSSANSASSSSTGQESHWSSGSTGDNPSSQNYISDLVPEFEPGKPWKGNQVKNIEDDPTITPGSVGRSPLSIATIKDSDIFSNIGGDNSHKGASGASTNVNGSAIPGTTVTTSMDSVFTSGLTLSSTWSFPSSIASSKGAWSDGSSDIWGPKSRGPPPGMANKSGAPGSGTSSWAGLGSGSNSGNNSSGNRNWGWSEGGQPVRSGPGSSASGGSNPNSSTWLVLKNLTPQIDGSTLKTLCMQHGPLSTFHLVLQLGVAFVKYNSREETIKAQNALNNCVLGNTTILADSTTEAEVQAFISGPSGQNQGGSGSNPSTWVAPNAPTPTPAPSKAGGDTWSSWPSSGSSSVWGPAGLNDSDPGHASSHPINSLLPGDLLGGENM